MLTRQATLLAEMKLVLVFAREATRFDRTVTIRAELAVFEVIGARTAN